MKNQPGVVWLFVVGYNLIRTILKFRPIAHSIAEFPLENPLRVFHRRRRWLMGAFALLVVVPIAAGAAELEIKKAEWKDRKSELNVEVEGEHFRRSVDVTVTNADTGEALFAASPRVERGKFRLSFSRTIPQTSNVPCRVAVEAGGASAVRKVHDAPEDCNTGTPPEPNLPPVADAGEDQALTLDPGAASIDVTLDGSGSHDPDGTIVAYEWSGMPDPDDVVNPQVSLGAGSFTFTLVAIDDQGARSEPSSVLVLVSEAPTPNLPPVANAGDDQVLTLGPGETTIAVMLDGSGSFDPDGNVTGYVWTGSPNPGDVASPQVTLAAGTYTFTLVVSDNTGAQSEPDSVSVTVREFVAETPHGGLTFANYKGSETCRTCHAQQTAEAHDSVHYQWRGMSPHAFFRDGTGQLVNLGIAGKLGGINDFCGFPDINFIGILTKVDGTETNGGCAQCHTGGGDKPDFNIEASLADGTRDQGDNIDCLMCHSDMYERKVARVTQADGVTRLAFVPDGDAIPGGLAQAISDIRKRPSVQSCVGCHAYAGGGCNSKRGDIQLIHTNPPSAEFDVHMAPASMGGAGLHCLDCHVSAAHKIAGRGADLRPTDLDQTVACTNCHASQPHDSSRLNRHTARVDCRSCHIPSFAKGNTPDSDTDVFRDYRQPPVLNTAKGLYEPFQVGETNVIPELRFFNGDSEFYRFGDSVQPQANGVVLMAGPLGAVTNSNAKIIPLKHHRAYQPVDLVDNAILPLKMGILFTGRFGGSLLPTADIVPRAILQGAAEVPQFAHVQSTDDFTFVATERFMGISHEVEPAGNALSCNACHGGTSQRIDFASLGYTPLAARNPDVAANCASGCHGDKSDEFSPSEFFTKLHQKHVDDKRINCNACHGFSAAQ